MKKKKQDESEIDRYRITDHGCNCRWFMCCCYLAVWLGWDGSEEKKQDESKDRREKETKRLVSRANVPFSKTMKGVENERRKVNEKW